MGSLERFKGTGGTIAKLGMAGAVVAGGLKGAQLYDKNVAPINMNGQLPVAPTAEEVEYYEEIRRITGHEEQNSGEFFSETPEARALRERIARMREALNRKAQKAVERFYESLTGEQLAAVRLAMPDSVQAVGSLYEPTITEDVLRFASDPEVSTFAQDAEVASQQNAALIELRKVFAFPSFKTTILSLVPEAEEIKKLEEELQSQPTVVSDVAPNPLLSNLQAL